MSNGVGRHNKVSCGDLRTSSGQGTQGVRLGTATSMLTHSHTNGNSDETSAAGRSSIHVSSRSARGSSLSPLRSGTVLEQVSLAVPAPGVDVEGWQVRTLTDSPAAAARATEAPAPLLHRRVQGMMPVRPDNGDFVSLNRTAAIASPVRNTRYFRIGKVPIVKLDDPRDNRLPPYANTRPGTVRIAPPDDVPLSAILATSEVPTTSKELKEKPTDVASVLKVLKAKSRKRCLLDRCDSSHDRAASNAVDTSYDYFSTDAVSDQRRDSKRRRLEEEEEEEEDKEEISCESMEMTAAGASPIGGTKWSSEAADSTNGKNRAGAVGPDRAKRSSGLDSASRRNAIASSYSALLPIVRPKSQGKSGAVDLSADENSEESVSRNGSTILVKSLVGSVTQRSGTPASAAGGINSSSRSLVSDAAATDGSSLEPKGTGDVCGTPPSSGRIPLRRRNPEIFHHLTDRFKNVPKATFTPSLEDYAIDELADRERLSRMVGGTFVAPAVSVAMAAVAPGKPQVSAIAASAPSSISAADKVPALASTVIVPLLSAPSETSALGLRTTTSAEKTTSAPSSFSFGSADVSSGNRSSSTIAPPGGHHATDSGAASSTSSAGPLQPAGLSSVSTSQPPPPPTYASATASSGGTAAAVPVSIGLSAAVVAPAQGAATADQGPARPPLLFGCAGVSSAATSLSGQAASVTAPSSGTSFAQSSVVPSSTQSETQPSSAGLATLTKVTTVGSGTFALPVQSLGQPPPSAATTAASSVAKSTPFASSMAKVPSQTTMGSGAGGVASAATTAASAGSLSSASTAASSISAASAAGAAAATSNASGVAAFSFPSAFTTGSGSLFGAASRLEHASSIAAVSAPSNPATMSLATAATAAPSLPTFGSGSASLFGSSFGGKPSTGDTVDGGAQKQLAFTFGSATNSALPTATASSAPAMSSAPVTSSAPATSSVLATSSTPAGSSAPTAAFAFGSGLFGAVKDKDTVAPGVAAAASAAAPTFAFGSGLFGAAKDKDAAASSAAAAAAASSTFAFGGGLFGAAKDKDSLAPSAAAAAAPAPVVPTFSFGGSGSSVAAKDVPGTSSSTPGMTFAFGSNRPFGAAKDAATSAGTFGTGSLFGGAAAAGGGAAAAGGGAAGAAAQLPAFGGGSAAPTATAVPQPSSGVFGAASAVKGIGGAFGGSAGGNSASAVGSVPLLFGVSSSVAAPTATSIATTAAGTSGLPAASATAVAPSFGIFGSTALPAASTASTAAGAPSGSSSSVFGGLFGAGKVVAAATTAGSGVQPALPFAFGQSAGASGTSSAGPTPTFGIGQAQLPLPTGSAGAGTAASHQAAAALNGAAQPAGQQQPSFMFGSTAATAPSTAGGSNLFGTPAATGAPAAFNFSFGGGSATAQPAAQPAKTSGFSFGNATSPGSTFVFGAQANSATAGTTTPAASAFGMSPASFGATPLSSLPTGDQGSFANIFTAGSASNSSVRQRQAVRRTGVAGRLGKR